MMTYDSDESITKVLVPRRRPDTVRRRRLLDLLHEGLERRLTIVHAPAGYGKTTLLVDWVHDLGMPVCWLSLDESDEDPATLLRYLLLSLRHRLPGAASAIDEAAALMSSSGPLPAERIVGRIVTSLHCDIGEPVTIILDDFHNVEACEPVVQIVSRLLVRLPPNCHLVISGRTKPSLPGLLRLEGQREVATLDASLLAFTVDEIGHYFSSIHGVELGKEEAKRLATATEGWVAALALMPQASMPAGLGMLNPARTFDYLAAEVFDGLDRQLQEFLVVASVLSEVDAELCDALLARNDSSRMLREIETRNLFLTSIDRGDVSWRFHPLFQEFLVSRFKQEQPDHFATTNARAGRLLATRGRWAEAIRHFAEAGLWDEAASVAEQAAAEAFAQGRWQAIAGWLEAFPASKLSAYPRLVLWRARILYQLAQADKALEVAATAIASLEGQGDAVSLADAYIIRGMALRLKGQHLDAAEACRRATVVLTTADGPVKSLAEARKQLGMVHLDQGSLALALDDFKAVLDIYETSGDTVNAALVHECIGLALGKLGQLSESGVHLEKARQGWHRLGNHKELATVLNNLGMLYSVQGETDKALALFHDAIGRARQSGYPRAEAYALASIADIQRDRGAYNLAIEQYNLALDLAGDVGDTTLCTLVLTSLGDTHRLSGDLDKAEILMCQAAADAKERESSYELGIAEISLGLLWRERNDSAQAVAYLSEAADLLAKCQAKREQAIAQFHLGETLFSSRRGRTKAVRALEEAARLSRDLGCDHFLAERGAAALEMIQYAASKRVADGFYRALLGKITSRRQLTQRRIRPARSKKEGSPSVELFVLGPMEVFMGGRQVLDFEWQSEKSKEMMLFLLRQREPARKEEILAALWPDLPRDKCNSSFHSTLYRLRRALYAQCVMEQGGRYSLNPRGRFWCDAVEFESLVQVAEQARGESTSWTRKLRRATELYRGPFGSDFYSDWLEPERRRLEDMCLRSLARLAKHERLLNKHLEAASLYEKAVALDPLNESLWFQLVDTYGEAGQVEAATRCYRRYAEIVRDQLGEEPTATLTDLYHRLRGSRSTP